MEHARRAAAARPGQPTRGQADFTGLFVALGRRRSNVAVADAGTDNMVHFASTVQVDNREFYMGMPVPTTAWPPWPVRPGPRVTWASPGRARCAVRWPWASEPPLPHVDDLIVCMQPRRS